MYRRISLILLTGFALHAAGVRVEFNPYRPGVGPFPSDLLTVADERQRTGVRVNLPAPDCTAAPSDCAEIRQLNLLDGFNPNTRLTVRFSGPINPDTLRDGIFFVYADQRVPGRFALEPEGRVIPINQVIYDPATYTVTAKPDAILEGSRRYLIVVTTGVRDVRGDPVERDEGFQACLDRQVGGDYCAILSRRVGALSRYRVAGASLYTTLSTSAWFEQARTAIEGISPDFRRPEANAVIDLAKLGRLTIHQQTGASRFDDFVLPLPGLILSQNGVGRVAFGTIRTPRFLNAGLTIPLAPTGTALATPAEALDLPFHVWLPQTAKPANGYPVLLALHGFNDSQWGEPSFVALAAGSGFAVAAASTFGHGYGPRTTVRFSMTDGTTIEVPSPGRGLDIDGDGRIGSAEGCVVLGPGQPTGFRDCARQTVIDWMQLVRAIQAGMDLDGDGGADLDSTRISLLGQSLGGALGTLLAATAPAIGSAVLNVPPGAEVDTFRWSPVFHPVFGVAAVSNRQPSLLNQGADFDDDMPFPWEAVRIRTLPGAAQLQDFFERSEWLSALATPTFLAPYLKQATLPGSPIKRVLFQFALGDKTVPNPSTSALIRAANLREQSTLYRADLAKAAVPSMLDDPHSYLVPLGPPQSLFVSIATLQQAILFLQSPAGVPPPDVNSVVRPIFGADLFETPATLPERP